MGGEDLNKAADMFSEDEGGEPEAEFTDTERPSGVYKKRGRPPKRRGQAPAFGPSKGTKARGGGHRDDPTARTAEPPEWMTRAWAGDTSLLPKKPPGRS